MPTARGRASAPGVHRLSRATEPPARGLHPARLASSPLCVATGDVSGGFGSVWSFYSIELQCGAIVCPAFCFSW